MVFAICVFHGYGTAAAGGGGDLSPPTGGGSSSDGAKGATFWIVAQTGGGVTSPNGPSSPCSRWEEARFDGEPPAFNDAFRSEDGTLWQLYTRDCEGASQFVWVPLMAGDEVADEAYDVAVGKIRSPVPEFFPAAEYGIVNVETLFGAAAQATQSATAQIPGLAATVTATPVLLRLETGSQVAGDVTVVECRPWGSVEFPTACAWTPRYPSVERVTGTDDYRYHGTFSVVWEVSWSATDGSSGVFDDVVVSTPVLLAVREIQTY